MKKVVIYTRTAAAPGMEDGALQDQTTQCQAYARNLGFEVVGVLSDSGCSGMTMDRPGVHQMWQLITERGVDAILVTDWNRLSRDWDELVAFLQKCARQGVTVYCCSAGQQDSAQLFSLLAAIKATGIKRSLRHAASAKEQVGRRRSATQRA